MEEYIKNFDAWNERVKVIDHSKFDDFIYEREIWWCALGVNIGSEQDGKNDTFERPVLIVKKINKDLLLVAPLTSKITNSEYCITTTSSGVLSQVILSQLRVISSKRLLRKISRIKTLTFYQIISRLCLILLGVLRD